MGQFSGRVVAEWLTQEGDDRDMRLLEDFSYVDGEAVAWQVVAGSVINGASIPQVFWSTFGSPFLGDYRRASVLHDYYCQQKNRSSDAVHTMFYEACLDGGVSVIKSKSMYLAVASFGPHWKTVENNINISGIEFNSGSTINAISSLDAIEYQNMQKWVETANPSIDEIQQAVKGRRLIGVRLPPAAIDF